VPGPGPDGDESPGLHQPRSPPGHPELETGGGQEGRPAGLGPAARDDPGHHLPGRTDAALAGGDGAEPDPLGGRTHRPPGGGR